MAVRPMLDELELPLVQTLESAHHQERARHAVPALEGDFLQAQGRRAARFTLAGVLVDEDGTVKEELKKLREKFRAAQPVAFVADIASAVRVDTVLIEEMSVRELAGKPERFEYAFTLREYIPAPAPEIIPPPPVPPPPTTSLSVDVIVEGRPGYDYSQVTVTVRGTQDDGSTPERTLTHRENNVWTEDPFPPGNYRARAVAPDPEVEGTDMSNEAPAEVLEGQRKEVHISLNPGQRRNRAVAYLVHYWFDKSFIEPCLRPVLREVARRAGGGREKLLIVGHTDLVGSDDYNQALSERRARGTHAYLTFGNDADAAVAEWNELCKPHANPLNDEWGVREYQYMLQAVGCYTGPINERHDTPTDQAVRAFQHGRGLAEDGIVGDETWPVLIRDYLALDSLSVPDSVFFRNAREGCDGGPLRWIGCGEKDPLPDEHVPPQPPRDTAWRPYRRTEMLFVVADEIPPQCRMPRPKTWEVRPDGSPVPDWCFGPGDAGRPCCFLSRDATETDRWRIEPAHPETVQVQGRITYEDGRPYAGRRYALIAPDGEFLHETVDRNGVKTSDENGEWPTGPQRGRPNHGRTDAEGRFSHPTPTPVGTYILELHFQDLTPPEVVRESSAPPSSARGNVICLAAAPAATPGGTLPEWQVVVQPGPVATAAPNPSITLAAPFVAVKKPHTNPSRVLVTLRSDVPFNGSGTVERSGNTAAVRLFTAATGGTEIGFDGTDNVFSGADLAAGVQLFAETGPAPSGAVDDYVLTLTLADSGACAPPAAAPATATLTAVLFTLDIALSRTAPGVDPPVLSEADKINVGRHVQVRDPGFTHERAMLIVRQPVPAVAATLELVPQNGRVEAFNDELPAATQPPIATVATPAVLAPGSVSANGIRFFAEGVSPVSASVRDTGFGLRVRELRAEVDRVAVTTIQIELIATANNTAPPVAFVRIGLWDHAFDATTGALRNAEAEGNNFVGQDSRNFCLRVRDASASGEVLASWRTTFTGTGADDDVHAQPEATLPETSPGSHAFISKGLILVADNVDRTQATNSGLPGTHPEAGLRTPAQRNHRLRRITVSDTRPLDSSVAVSYNPASSGLIRASIAAPVFQRSPEERRRLRVHLVNVRTTVGGSGILSEGRRNQVMDLFRSIYATCGVFAEIDELMLDPPASCIGWPGRYPTDPLAIDPSVEGFSFPGGVNLIPSASQTDIINRVRAQPSFAANDIYIVCVARVYSTVPPPPGPGLVTGGGEAFPDSWTAPGSIARGFGFVGVRATNVLAEVHEATHITTDLRNAAGGHFDLGASNAAAPGPLEGKNLMHRFVLIANGTISDSKRLWNTSFTNTHRTPNMIIPAQIDAIRGSRFVRNY